MKLDIKHGLDKYNFIIIYTYQEVLDIYSDREGKLWRKHRQSVHCQINSREVKITSNPNKKLHNSMVYSIY